MQIMCLALITLSQVGGRGVGWRLALAAGRQAYGGQVVRPKSNPLFKKKQANSEGTCERHSFKIQHMKCRPGGPLAA